MTQTPESPMDEVTAMQTIAYPQENDSAEICRAKGRAIGVVHRLLMELAPPIFRGYRFPNADLDDLIQDATMNMARSGPFVKPKHPTTPQSVRNYLRCALHNWCRRRYKTLTQRSEDPLERREDEGPPREFGQPADQLDKLHVEQVLSRFVDDIVPRTAATLKRPACDALAGIVDGMLAVASEETTNKELAGEQGIKLGTLQKHHQRGREAILRWLDAASARGELSADDAEVFKSFVVRRLHQRTARKT